MKSSQLKYSHWLLLLFILVFIFFTGCENKAIIEKENVNAVIYRLISADNKGDIETVLHSYTDNIEFYPAGRNFTKGIKNVRLSYEKLFKENSLAITTQISDTKICDNTAIITGVNTGTKKSKVDSGIAEINDHYIAVLVRDNETWKIDKLIWAINP